MLLALAQCGTNVADCSGKFYCAEKSDDNTATEAFESGDLETARTITEAQIEAAPSEYFRYPRLAAIYAETGTIVIQDLISGILSGGDPMTAVAESFQVPPAITDDEFTTNVEWVNKAKDILLAVPEDIREGEEIHGISAQFQLSLYETVLGQAFINKATVEDGEFDPDALSDDEASDLLENLRGASEHSEDLSPELAENLSEFITAIDAAEGGTDKEKIQAVLAAQESSQ